MNEPVLVQPVTLLTPLPDPDLIADRMSGGKAPGIRALPVPESEAEAEIGDGRPRCGR
jgi:hypothetical protein